jgi:hypothetical protein
MRGETVERPLSAGVGIHGIFSFGETNHKELPNGSYIYPDICPDHSNASALGDIPTNFSTPGNQPQVSWAEGNHLKIFGCRTKKSASGNGWQFFLYNLTSDRAETTDLWGSQRSTAQAMLQRLQAWHVDVLVSQGPTEMGCSPATPTPGPPTPTVPITPIAGMQNVKARCSDDSGNHLGTEVC